MSSIHEDGSVVKIVGIDYFGRGFDKYDRLIVAQEDLNDGSIIYLGKTKPSTPDFEEFKKRCIASEIDITLQQMKILYNEVVIGTDWE